MLCPNCRTAELVRASVVEQGFWTTLLQITLPLLVLAIVGALLYRIGRPVPRAPAELDRVQERDVLHG